MADVIPFRIFPFHVGLTPRRSPDERAEPSLISTTALRQSRPDNPIAFPWMQERKRQKRAIPQENPMYRSHPARLRTAFGLSTAHHAGCTRRKRRGQSGPPRNSTATLRAAQAVPQAHRTSRRTPETSSSWAIPSRTAHKEGQKAWDELTSFGQADETSASAATRPNACGITEGHEIDHLKAEGGGDHDRHEQHGHTFRRREYAGGIGSDRRGTETSESRTSRSWCWAFSRAAVRATRSGPRSRSPRAIQRHINVDSKSRYRTSNSSTLSFRSCRRRRGFLDPGGQAEQEDRRDLRDPRQIRRQQGGSSTRTSARSFWTGTAACPGEIMPDYLHLSDKAGRWEPVDQGDIEKLDEVNRAAAEAGVV